ncbi:MAG TPA: glycosyltransferase [Fermentimonas sp.]|nr:glycosyltransferase [Fermentimonas sp.]
MRILHFSLGPSPLRSGGLVRYVEDVSTGQAQCGHSVMVLFPGFSSIQLNRRATIQHYSFDNDVKYVSIQNGAPLPLLHGIKDPRRIEELTNRLDYRTVEEFFGDEVPDVFHIHTLMSLPLSLVKFFAAKGTRIVYTSHDYYGLCMKVNLIDAAKRSCSGPAPIKCEQCNVSSKSFLYLWVRNSKFVLSLKRPLARLGGWISRKSSPISAPLEKGSFVSKNALSYSSLLRYHREVFSFVNVFHFNSTLTKDFYLSLLGSVPLSKVLPVVHKGIYDRRSVRSAKKHVRLGFIGSFDAYKGFPLLKNALEQIMVEGFNNWTLDAWGNFGNIPSGVESRIKYRGRYNGGDLNYVFSEMDLLIVPSWRETFSLVTLEALSFGVPVMVSKNVGAKDLLPDSFKEFVFEVRVDDLVDKIRKVLSNTDALESFNDWIFHAKLPLDFSAHLLELQKVYQMKS